MAFVDHPTLALAYQNAIKSSQREFKGFGDDCNTTAVIPVAASDPVFAYQFLSSLFTRIVQAPTIGHHLIM